MKNKETQSSWIKKAVQQLLFVSDTIATENNEIVAVQKCLDALNYILPYKAGAFIVYTEELNEIEVYAEKGHIQETIDKINSIPIEDTIADKAMKKRDIVSISLEKLIEQNKKEQLYKDFALKNINYFISIPVIFRDDCLSSINLCFEQEYKIEEFQKEWLKRIATAMSYPVYSYRYKISLEQKFKARTNTLIDQAKKLKNEINKRIQAEKELKKIAITDKLTGLFNYSYFENKMEYISNILDDPKNCKRAKQTNIAIILFDIDHFKGFNDTHGHTIGNSVLKHVASLMKKEVRKSDITCRYGGEEFVVILPKTNINGAFQVAEKIRKRIEKEPLTENNQKLNITISGGIAIREKKEDLETFVSRADNALYKSKENGRNKITIFKDDD